MMPTLQTQGHPAFDPMSPPEAGAALLAQARALQRAAQSGTTQPLLKGKNLGLLCETADAADAVLFQRAAAELGAHVSHIRPSLSEASTAHEVAHTARMLGRLYDAVECQGMPPALVTRMGEAAGVPVYGGIATAGHPTARLAEQLEGGLRADDNRRFVLQAFLLSTLA
ncbi:ornithine carbamoyltransferase [Piscinibacter sp. XHJ-5]|uniref:ornithine carbamoyltransferase n=1 Tax=Piscinibacter sp. XHJ-5 TaxID=3037797 RepID=UPI0024532970|nr:ornithine carbamoyltransferase [Piscinibacter sp. XHJ-5]